MFLAIRVSSFLETKISGCSFTFVITCRMNRLVGNTRSYIRLSEKFLSFYEEIIDAQRSLFYIILSNYVRSILFCWDKHRDILQIWFHVCMKVHCCKKITFAKEKYFLDNLNRLNNRIDASFSTYRKMTFHHLTKAIRFLRSMNM